MPTMPTFSGRKKNPARGKQTDIIKAKLMAKFGVNTLAVPPGGASTGRSKGNFAHVFAELKRKRMRSATLALPKTSARSKSLSPAGRSPSRSIDERVKGAFGYMKRMKNLTMDFGRAGRGRTPTLIKARTLASFQRGPKLSTAVERAASADPPNDNFVKKKCAVEIDQDLRPPRRTTDGQGAASSDDDGSDDESSTGSVRARNETDIASEQSGSHKRSFAEDLWDRFSQVAAETATARHDMKVTLHFFEDIASAENKFAERLNRASRSAETYGANTSMSRPWTQLSGGIRALGGVHDTVSSALSTGICSKLSGMVDEMKEELVNKRATYKSVHAKLDALRDKYEKRTNLYLRAQELAEVASEALAAARASHRPDKAIQKLERECEIRRKDVRQRISDLEKSVHKLANHQRKTRESDAQMMSELQALQGRRVGVLRQALAEAVSLLRRVAKMTNDTASKAESALESVTPEKDMQDFIAQLATGRLKPPIVTIRIGKDGRPVTQKVSENLRHKRAGVDIKSQALSPAPRVAHFGPIEKLPGEVSAGKDNIGSGGPESDPDFQGLFDEFEGLSAADCQNNLFVALHAYYDETETEVFGFQPGDRIHVIERRDDGWWKGTCRTVTGFFPREFVRPVGSWPRALMLNGDFRVVWSFRGEAEDEISLNKGDVVEVTAAYGGWCVGRKKYSAVGTDLAADNDSTPGTPSARRAPENVVVPHPDHLHSYAGIQIGIFPAEYVEAC